MQKWSDITLAQIFRFVHFISNALERRKTVQGTTFVKAVCRVDKENFENLDPKSRVDFEEPPPKIRFLRHISVLAG
jgi:hypothetical protein